ncbi:PKD domain-containing protein, partial [Desulfomarina sp.]
MKKRSVTISLHRFTCFLYFLVFIFFPVSGFSAEFTGTLGSVTITDAKGENAPPAASFTYTVNENDVFLDAGSSTDTDGTILEYRWDFGDSTTGSGVNVTHTYAEPNVYQVTLTLVDDKSGIALLQKEISTVQSGAAVEQLNEDGDTGNITQNRTYGQGIIFSTPVTVSSITIKSGPSKYGNPPMRIRIGKSLDLSSSYLGESEEVVFDNKNTEYEFIFSPGVALDANTQYFFAVAVTN